MPEFWNFWIFLSITVFREFWGWEFWNFLSIAVFRGLNFTKHCNAQKFQHFREYGPGLDIDARILEFLEFLSITGFREIGD